MAGRCCCLIDWCFATTFSSIVIYLRSIPCIPFNAALYLVSGRCSSHLGSVIARLGLRALTLVLELASLKLVHYEMTTKTVLDAMSDKRWC
jgi:hypothetical protein